MTTVSPTVTGITFDQPSYAPGATITATVTYTAGASDTQLTFTGVATDPNTGTSGQMEGTFTVQASDPTTVTVSDSGNRTWTQVPGSDTGTQVQFTATA